MGVELRSLYNAMTKIETKGESTKTMCDCLRFLEQLIAKSEAEKNAAEDKESENKE